MHSNSTKRRSKLIYKSLKVVMVAWICIVAASPFVLVLDSANKIVISENIAQAFEFRKSMQNVAIGSGLTTSDGSASLVYIIGEIIQGALGLTGVVALIIISIAGYRWAMAGGDENTVKNAKSSIKNGIIGILITMGAYAITGYIIKVITLK